MALLDLVASAASRVPLPIWILLLPTSLYLLYRSLQPRLLPGIPIGYPPGYTHVPWLMGFGPEMGKVMRETGGVIGLFDQTGETYGPIWQMPIGPAGTWLSRLTGFGEVLVACNDSQEIEDACTRRANSFAKALGDTEPFAVALPTGQIALLSGPKHRHHRRVFGPSMTGAYLARMVPRIEGCVDDLVSLWKARRARAGPDGKKPFDVRDDFLLAATDVITSLAFGKAFGGINGIRDYLSTAPPDLPAESSPPIPRLTQCVLILLKQVASVAFAGPVGHLYTLYYRHISKATKDARLDLVREMEARIAGERELRSARGQDGTASPHDADYVLGMVLDGEAADIAKGNLPLPHNELCDELLTYVFGGSETTSTALGWTVKYLARHPHVQQRLRAELVERLPQALHPAQAGRSPLNFAQLNDETLLPYMHATTYECLRLAQVAGGIGRTTVQDTTLLGYHVPAGTRCVFLTAWAQAAATEKLVREREERQTREGRRPKDGQRKWGYWGDDVSEFRPERWLKPSADGKTMEFDRLAGPWIPFGAGARGCFGKSLAILEFRVFLVKLVGAFFFEPVERQLDGDEAIEVLTRHPCQSYVRLKPFAEAPLTTPLL